MKFIPNNQTHSTVITYYTIFTNSFSLDHQLCRSIFKRIVLIIMDMAPRHFFRKLRQLPCQRKQPFPICRNDGFTIIDTHTDYKPVHPLNNHPSSPELIRQLVVFFITDHKFVLLSMSQLHSCLFKHHLRSDIICSTPGSHTRYFFIFRQIFQYFL